MIPFNFFFLLPLCQPAAAPLQDLCDRVDPPLPDEDRGDEAHPAGDLSEVLQDAGEQAEDRAEEESPAGSSPPQVPPKIITQLSVGDGERARLARAMLRLTRFTPIKCSMIKNARPFPGMFLHRALFRMNTQTCEVLIFSICPH